MTPAQKDSAAMPEPDWKLVAEMLGIYCRIASSVSAFDRHNVNLFHEWLSQREQPAAADAVFEDTLEWIRKEPAFAEAQPIAAAEGDQADDLPASMYGLVNKPPAADGGAVSERGEWRVLKMENGERALLSNDFTHDVLLRVNGDFSNDRERDAYCEWLAARLTTATALSASAERGGQHG